MAELRRRKLGFLWKDSPVQVSRQETQRPEVRNRKLVQQFPDPGEDFLHVGARPLPCMLALLVSAAPLLGCSLGLLGQSDEVVVEPVEDQRLR